MSKRFVVGRSLVALGVAAGAIGVAPIVGTANASAMDCTQYGANRDAGYLYTSGPYHTGPAAKCKQLKGHSGKAFIWCSKYNGSGNLWYFVRDATDNTIGWVWAGNVSKVVNSNHKRC